MKDDNLQLVTYLKKCILTADEKSKIKATHCFLFSLVGIRIN